MEPLNIEPTIRFCVLVGVEVARTEYQYSGICKAPTPTKENDLLLDKLVEKNPCLKQFKRDIYVYGCTNK